MKIFLVALLLSWYFGIRLAHETPDAFISMVVGPFKTEAICKAYYEQTLEASIMLFGLDNFVASPCRLVKGTEI